MNLALLRPSLRLACAAGVAIAALAISTSARGDDGDKPSIEKIMKTMHKGDNSVVKRIVKGTATPDEVKTLLADYKLMLTLEPPKGTVASWKGRVNKVIVALTAIDKGDAAGVPKFKAAVSCKSCHEAHKED